MWPKIISQIEIESISCLPLFRYWSKSKGHQKKLRAQTSARPKIDIEHFTEELLFNRLVFKYNLARK